MISITLLNPNGFQTFDPLTIQTFRNSSLITIPPQFMSQNPGSEP